MRLMDENRIDELHDEYDSRWVRYSLIDNADVTELTSARQRVLKFLDAKGVARRTHPELVESLCETELERDWMWWRKWLESHLTKDDYTIDSLIAEFERNAKVSDFKNLFASNTDDTKRSLDHLYRIELRSRAKWGDYPRACCQLKHRLPMPRQLLVHRNGEKLVVISLHEKMEFGRQRSNEASLGAHGNRGAISDRGNTYVSRRQFEIQILSPQYAVIQNLSSTVPMKWGGSSSIGYMQKLLIVYPAYVRVGDLDLYIA